MQKLPHRYQVAATCRSTGPVGLVSAGLETLESAPPAEYGGPGDKWSPETLLVGAVVDCFVLTFRAIARGSSLDWNELECRAEGVLDRSGGITRFTEMTLRARLELPVGTDAERGARLLEKAEKNCLITNSLACPVKLEHDVKIG